MKHESSATTLGCSLDERNSRRDRRRVDRAQGRRLILNLWLDRQTCPNRFSLFSPQIPYIYGVQTAHGEAPPQLGACSAERNIHVSTRSMPVVMVESVRAERIGIFQRSAIARPEEYIKLQRVI
jgi:hypothetical protein